MTLLKGKNDTPNGSRTMNDAYAAIETLMANADGMTHAFASQAIDTLMAGLNATEAKGLATKCHGFGIKSKAKAIETVKGYVGRRIQMHDHNRPNAG
jgi:hypothetical protein